MIRLRDFSVKFGRQRVFPPLSLAVARGERVALAGESGCGKTTILKAVAGLLDPPAAVDGEVLNPGPDVIGYVPQESIASLSPYLTILQQVAHLGKSEEQARQLLGRLGLGDPLLLRSYPHQVSGGQRQRVLIAQALIVKPAFLLCDEPVANLDPATARETVQIIDDYLLHSGAGLLIASHRESRSRRSVAVSIA